MYTNCTSTKKKKKDLEIKKNNTYALSSTKNKFQTITIKKLGKKKKIPLLLRR